MQSYTQKNQFGAWWEMNLRGTKVDTGRSVRKLQHGDPDEMNLRLGQNIRNTEKSINSGNSYETVSRGLGD